MGNLGTDKRLGEWLDNDDVCRVLRISQRTLQTSRDNGVEDAMKSMKDIESLFDKMTSNYRPFLNGERYLSDVEVSHRLKVSRRTLQDYRDNGTLPYFKLGGKVLYRESDLEALLQRCYHPVISKAV